MEKRDFEKIDWAVNRVKDFPKPGILYYDITGILHRPQVFSYCIERMCEIYRKKKIDAVAGIEARGFIFASPFAQKMGIPLILIRKKGKLPGKTFSCSYSLEYGQAQIEVHCADIQEGQNILLVDDLVATGGTFAAAIKLVAQGGASVKDVFGVIGLPFLNFKSVLSSVNVTTLVDYNEE